MNFPNRKQKRKSGKVKENRKKFVEMEKHEKENCAEILIHNVANIKHLNNRTDRGRFTVLCGVASCPITRSVPITVPVPSTSV